MTVNELIQLLASYSPDLRVVVNGYEEGYEDIDEHLVFVRELRLNAGKEWWEGVHRESWDARAEGTAVVDAVVLQRPMRL